MECITGCLELLKKFKISQSFFPGLILFNFILTGEAVYSENGKISGDVTEAKFSIYQTGRLKAYDESIKTLSASSDGSRIAAISDSGELTLWNFSKTKFSQQKRFKAFKENYGALAISPDGDFLVSSGEPVKENDDFIFMNIKKNTAYFLSNLKPFYKLEFSHDGKLLAGSTGQYLVLYERSGDSLDEVFKLHTSGAVVKAVSFISRSKKFAAGIRSEILIYQRTSRNHFENIQTINEHKTEIAEIAFSNDGRIMLSACARELIVWKLNGSKYTILKKYKISVSSISFHPEGRYFIAGINYFNKNKDILLFKINNENEVSQLDYNQLLPQADGTKNAIWLSGSKGIISVTKDIYDKSKDLVTESRRKSTIRFLNFNTENYIPFFRLQLPQQYNDYYAKVFKREKVDSPYSFGLSLHPDEKLLALARYSGGISLWKFSKGKFQEDSFVKMDGLIGGVDFRSDGKVFASHVTLEETGRQGYKTRVLLFDAEKKEYPVIQELNERISSNSGQSLTEFSNDGKYLAALTPELKSNVFIYQNFSGKYKKIRLLEGRQLDLKFSPRSNLLYTFDMQQGKIREWNLKNNTVHSLHETKGDYSKLEIHPKKEIIAAAVETGSSQRPEIKLFEKTGAKYKLLQTIYPVNIGPTSRNTGGRVLDIKFTPDGKYLIAVGNESIIRIFYEMDGKYYLNQIVKSDLPMAHLEFLENGRYIAAANTGGQVTFYKMINSSLQ